ATLDRVSSGRFLFGIGGGWNVEEMANHGVEFKDRWTVTREFVLAMRAIWSSPEAEFHGKFVDFERIWSWPKPVQKGGPPVAAGGRRDESNAQTPDGVLQRLDAARRHQ